MKLELRSGGVPKLELGNQRFKVALMGVRAVMKRQVSTMFMMD
jgi:hypothetical protein